MWAAAVGGRSWRVIRARDWHDGIGEAAIVVRGSVAASELDCARIFANFLAGNCDLPLSNDADSGRTGSWDIGRCRRRRATFGYR